MTNKALMEFDGKKYWFDLTPGSMEFDVEENGIFRPMLKSEGDIFSIMETGKVIGTKKPAD